MNKLQQIMEMKDPSLRISRLLSERANAEAIMKMDMMKGEKGDDGYTPVKGKDYFTSTEIDSLVSHIRSIVKDGKDGINGKDGAKGEKGDTPIKGIDYWDKNDKEGIIKEVLARMPKQEKAVQVNHKALASEAIKGVIAENGIKIDHVEGLTKTLTGLKEYLKLGGYRGGGDTVAAGTGVTITTNSTGQKVINSSGGGFTTLAATGTVNGTNTAFTFTQKPTYIVSDHAWYQENKGWTWNAGTLTATMTIPPVDDIFGVA